MKTITALLLCLACAAHAQYERVGGYSGGARSGVREEVRHTVSNPRKARVPRASFVRDILPTVEGYGIGEDGSVIQTARPIIDMSGRWAMVPISDGSHEIKISQRLQEGLYLAYGDHLHNGSAVAVELPGQAVADGTLLRLKLTPADRIHSYQTVTGAAANIPVYLARRPPAAATPEEIVKAFDAGQAFSVIRPAMFTCDKCNGTKLEKYKRGTFTLTRPCSSCGGTGTVSLDVVWSVSK